MDDGWTNDGWRLDEGWTMRYDWWTTDGRLMDDWWTNNMKIDGRLMDDWWTNNMKIDRRLRFKLWTTNGRLMHEVWTTDGRLMTTNRGNYTFKWPSVKGRKSTKIRRKKPTYGLKLNSDNCEIFCHPILRQKFWFSRLKEAGLAKSDFGKSAWSVDSLRVW